MTDYRTDSGCAGQIVFFILWCFMFLAAGVFVLIYRFGLGGHV